MIKVFIWLLSQKIKNKLIVTRWHIESCFMVYPLEHNLMCSIIQYYTRWEEHESHFTLELSLPFYCSSVLKCLFAPMKENIFICIKNIHVGVSHVSMTGHWSLCLPSPELQGPLCYSGAAVCQKSVTKLVNVISGKLWCHILCNLTMATICPMCRGG